MAKIFIVRIEDNDFEVVRDEYMKESRQETDDEHVMRDLDGVPLYLRTGLLKNSR